MFTYECYWCKSPFSSHALDMDRVNDENTSPLFFERRFCSQKCRSEYRSSQSRNSPAGLSFKQSFSASISLIVCIVFTIALITNKGSNTTSSNPPTQQQKAVDPAYNEYMALGYRLTDEKDYEQALINFEKALAIVPNDPFATKAIANVRGFLAEKKYSEYMSIGYDLFEKKDKLGAISNFNKALEFKPRDSKASEAIGNIRYDLYTQLGKKLSGESDYKSAFITFDMAFKNKPNAPDAKQNLRDSSKYFASSLIKGESNLGSVSSNSKDKMPVALYNDLISQLEQNQSFEHSLTISARAFQENPDVKNTKSTFQETARKLAVSYIRR